MCAASQALGHHPDRRHDPRHRTLEAQLDPALARGVEHLLTVLGEQLLVGRDHVPACSQGPQHVLARRLDAAHQLDHQVAALEDVLVVAAAAREHAGDLGSQAHLGLDRVRALLDQLGEGSADGAVTEQADAKYPRGHGWLRHRGR